MNRFIIILILIICPKIGFANELIYPNEYEFEFLVEFSVSYSDSNNTFVISEIRYLGSKNRSEEEVSQYKKILNSNILGPKSRKLKKVVVIGLIKPIAENDAERLACLTHVDEKGNIEISFGGKKKHTLKYIKFIDSMHSPWNALENESLPLPPKQWVETGA